MKKLFFYTSILFVTLLLVQSCSPDSLGQININEFDISKSIPKATFANIDVKDAKELFKGQEYLFTNTSHSLDFENAFVLKSTNSDRTITPILDWNGLLAGIVIKDGEDDPGRFFGYAATKELISNADPVCDDKINAIASFFSLLEIFAYGRIPAPAFNTFLEKVSQLDCKETAKCSRETVEGTYVHVNDDGEIEVVGYTYTITITCGNSNPNGSGDNPIDIGGTNPDEEDPIDFDIPLSNGISPLEPPTEEEEILQTVNNLRDWLVNNCGFSYSNMGLFNVGAGAAFEKAVLDGFGLPSNSDFFDSDERQLATNNAYSRVQPDAVTDAFFVEKIEPENWIESITNYFTGDGEIIHTYDDLVFHEVKAYNTTVYLSTSDWQIAGHMDALADLKATSYANEDKAIPALYIYTLPDGKLSQGVKNEANAKGIQLFHVKMKIDAAGNVRVQRVVQVNAPGGPMSANLIPFSRPLQCPSISPSNRLDPEVLVE